MDEIINTKDGLIPDWAMHPGEHLEEYLESLDLSQAEFSRLSGLSTKLVSTLISGNNPVTAETALKLEKVLGLKAYVWTGIQASWDLYQAREAKKVQIGEDEKIFLSKLPVNEITKRLGLSNVRDMSKKLDCILDFASIGDFRGWDERCNNLAVNHRQSKVGESDLNHVVCWLLFGEHKARTLDMPPYNKEKFLKAIQKIKHLTVEQPKVFEPEMKRLCREAGVALVFEKPIPKTKLFGSARWIEGDRAIIQMSLRMKFNDHFWWTFFHECGHILLHKGKTFADDKGGEGNALETQADRFAEETLVGSDRLNKFIASNPNSKVKVRLFANECGVHPGIIVGMLQHRGVVKYRHMNALKVKFDWVE